jgi:fructose-1-phosphate kinase PfkB-like protein
MSAGEATLFLELYDSETGQILARVIDRRESRNNNLMMLAGSVPNAAEAEALAAQWARILRKALDKAHAATGAKK